VLSLELTSRLAGSRSRFIEYVLVLSDCHFLFAESLRLGRVQTALKPLNKGRLLFVVSLMARYVIKWSTLEHHSELNTFQIALDDTALDAAKSSIVFNVTKGVSTPGRAVRRRLIVAFYD